MLTPKPVEFATESIGTNCLGILTPLKFELDWLTTPMVVVDPDVVLTLPFIDPVMVLKLVGFVISPMPGLGDVMDNMCRSSSSSTESMPSARFSARSSSVGIAPYAISSV